MLIMQLSVFLLTFQLAGILEPNDCMCHMDSTGKYSKAEIQVTSSAVSNLVSRDKIIHLFQEFEEGRRIHFLKKKSFYFQDYPSVGQIIQKARENNINILFVIGGDESERVRTTVYNSLAAALPGGIDFAAELDTTSSNIIQIIGDSYRVGFDF